MDRPKPEKIDSQYPGSCSLTGLLLPLAIGAGLLGWYNWARFGSVLETGLRFQLSGINYLEYYNDVFSTKYVLLNLRYYLFTPL